MGRSITLAWAKFYEPKFQILTNCIKINIIFLKKIKKKKKKSKNNLLLETFVALFFFHLLKKSCNWIRLAALSSTSYGIVSLNSPFNDCSKRYTQQRIINDISKSFIFKRCTVFMKLCYCKHFSNVNRKLIYLVKEF